MRANTQKAVAIAALTFATALPCGVHFSPLLMNYTDSVPVGLYRQSKNNAAPYAGICLAKPIVEAAIQSGLEIGRGACPGGVAPILKPLIRASVQHRLAYTLQGFWIDGKLLPNTAPKTRSRSGAVLEHYRFGVYSSGAWAISDFNRDSYDSRYFGPVAPDAIRFYAKQVLTW